MSDLCILQGGALETLDLLQSESVQCCVTSPPYWGLRDYGHPDQIGKEPTPEAYVANLVQVFRDVRRLLKPDGTLWLNLGDSYSSGGRKTQVPQTLRTVAKDSASGKHANLNGLCCHPGSPENCKPKDLVGIPWMVAFALRADGWYLRCDIIWAKPNPMPESVRDRPTRAHEYLFLLSKSPKYFYDCDAVLEPCSLSQIGRVRDDQFGGNKGEKIHNSPGSRYVTGRKRDFQQKGRQVGHHEKEFPSEGRNRRTIWTCATKPYPEAHFATYPPNLIRPCILAGTRPGDTVLDPFAGSGTTGMVALEEGRQALLIELNPDYVKLIEKRCAIPPKTSLTLDDL